MLRVWWQQSVRLISFKRGLRQLIHSLPSSVSLTALCPSHLHEGVAVQSERSTGDPFEAFTHVRQRTSSQDLALMVKDESQSDTEEHLGAFIEKTVPDPQNCLQVQDTRQVSVTWYASTSPHSPCLSIRLSSPQLGECRCKGRWTSVTPPESICQDTGPWAGQPQEL